MTPLKKAMPREYPYPQRIFANRKIGVRLPHRSQLDVVIM
jgi:hypothetical protein